MNTTFKTNVYDRAIHDAVNWHRGQFRHDGVTPYITHPIEVAKGMQTHGIEDLQVLAAGVLHDVVEDCGVSLETIKANYGDRVSDIVEEVSKIGVDDSTIEEKMKFIHSFSNKSTDSLLLKIEDRYRNVKDYINFGNRRWFPAYYALQAYPLIQEFKKRFRSDTLTSTHYRIFQKYNETVIDELVDLVVHQYFVDMSSNFLENNEKMNLFIYNRIQKVDSK